MNENNITTTNIVWKILQLDRNATSGVVHTAHWICLAQDGEYSGSVYGTQSFAEVDPEDDSFIPYDEITEENVLDWIFNEMQDQVKAHEDNVLSQIDSKKNPVTVSGVPW